MGTLILNSWRAIALYMGRGVRTVQRWEQEIGLPVHRPHHRSRSPVLAIPSEIDDWLRMGGPKAQGNGHLTVRTVQASQLQGNGHLTARLELNRLLATLRTNTASIEHNRQLMRERLEQLEKTITRTAHLHEQMSEVPVNASRAMLHRD